MPYKEKEIEKLYYSIGEVAEMMAVNTSLLRYWEKEFDILRPKKNAKGDRFFTKADIENLKLIHHLVKDKGYTLDGARQQLRSRYEVERKQFQVVQQLQNIRRFLVELKDQLG